MSVRALAAGVAALALSLGATAADPDLGLAPLAPKPSIEVDLPPPPPSLASERMRQLEGQINELIATNRQQQEALLSLRNRLSTSQSASSWVPLLGIGFGAMSIVAGSLGVQLLRLNGERRRERKDERLKRLIDAGDADFASGPRHRMAAPATAPATPGSSVAMGEVPPTTPKTAPLTRVESSATQATAVLAGAGTVREVSVEEMLDLEQQADFFVALGQDEAAIDLLMGHIRGGGGNSPMPYLKLLEIYRRRADSENYARLRERFNLRFNAVAPNLDQLLDEGRDLEEYTPVVGRLVEAWARPSEAVAALDGLLAHRGTAEPFDLPAFRDLMLLSAIARDLIASAMPEAPHEVDLELPLDAGGDVAKQQPVTQPTINSHLSSNQSLPPELMSHLLVNRERYSGRATLDLDLSDFGVAPREFTRPATFTDVEQRDDHRRSDLSGFDELEPPARKRRH